MTEEKQKKIFSRNLQRLLDDRHKSQAEVAKAIDVSPQTFNTWVHGIAIPRMGKLQALADYFNEPKSALLEEDHNNLSFIVEKIASDDQLRRLMAYATALSDTEKSRFIDAFINASEIMKGGHNGQD